MNSSRVQVLGSQVDVLGSVHASEFRFDVRNEPEANAEVELPNFEPNSNTNPEVRTRNVNSGSSFMPS